MSATRLLSGSNFPHLLHDSGETLSSVENDGGQLRITPSRVAKQLLGELLAEMLRSVPDQALSDEDVIVVHADQDIRLPRPVEGFSGRVTFEDSVECHQ